jgi:hypothetical protein
LWLITDPSPAFGGLEKGSAFHLGSRLFWTKNGVVRDGGAARDAPEDDVHPLAQALRAGYRPDTMKRLESIRREPRGEAEQAPDEGGGQASPLRHRRTV